MNYRLDEVKELQRQYVALYTEVSHEKLLYCHQDVLIYIALDSL